MHMNEVDARFVKQNFYTSIISFIGNMLREKEFFDEFLANWSTLCYLPL